MSPASLSAESSLKDTLHPFCALGGLHRFVGTRLGAPAVDFALCLYRVCVRAYVRACIWYLESMAEPCMHCSMTRLSRRRPR